MLMSVNNRNVNVFRLNFGIRCSQKYIKQRQGGFFITVVELGVCLRCIISSVIEIYYDNISFSQNNFPGLTFHNSECLINGIRTLQLLTDCLVFNRKLFIFFWQSFLLIDAIERF